MTSSRLAAFLSPRSIALVGCPSDLSRPGARPLVYLRKHGYPGRIYPVNQRHAEIGGLAAYPTLSDLPDRPDTVWIGVPESDVLPVLEETARLKIPNAVIMTSGFGETDATGAAREARLRAVADEAGITVLGPNMLGFVNCWDRVPLTFSSAGAVDRLVPGALGVASQSGALGGVVVNRAFDRLIGVSAMVSTGNEIGVTVSECLEHFADDERTRAVALVVEGIRDGDRFRAAAERLLLAGKPLVALKLGRSSAGQRNALTHTGALAGSFAAWRAVTRQLGIVEVDSFEDLVELGGFLSRERRIVRRGAGVVTTSGGASIMIADQLEAHGVGLPRLAPATVATLGRMLPAYARTRDNPVDVTAGLSEALFGDVLEALVRDGNLDALVIAATSGGAERARNIARVALAADKPVVACWLGGSVIEAGRVVLDEQAVGCFRNPASAARALAAGRAVADARAERMRGPRASRPRRAERAERPRTYAELAAHARRAGVPLVDEALVSTQAGAARAARRLGFPVAVKVVSPELAHKTEAGALALSLATPEAVQRAAGRLLRSVRGRRVEGLLVQRMVRGVEVLVGVTRDATFGPLLVVGAGGVEAELLSDTSCRPLPVTRRDVAAMLSEVRALGRLHGFRGAPPSDVPALVDAILGVARLAEMLGNGLTALDVNPIIVCPRGEGAFAVDLLASWASPMPGVIAG
jgi:acyl-CoA synthetase (NDP forming)